MKNKKLLILSSLFLTFAMTSCGENFPSHVTYPEGDDGSVQTPYEEYDNGKRVESISFKENDVSLNLSEKVEYQIEASFAPSDAHNPKLTYTSNTPEIAVVDESGKVTMVAPGNASIKVSADNGVSSDFKISGYIPATSIRINPHVEGGTLLDIYDSKQFSIAAEPVNATQKDVAWSVVDKDGNPSTVAVISETGLLSFENAKGVHDEEVYVVATSKADASLVATEKVIVNDARKYASSVKINKDGAEVSTIDVLLGSPEQLIAVVDPVDHTNPVSWSSEDATVATVDEGLVSAVKAPATTNVKASIDGLESKVVVNTTKIDVSSVTLDKTELTLNKGEEATLVATVAPADASFPDVSFVVADGSNEFVSIDDNGKVTAKKQTGDRPAKVMAVSKDNSEIFAECSVTVTNKVTAIEIVNNYEKMYYGGETYTLSLDKTPYDCDSFNVTWTSSNDSIATVDNNGVVTTNSSELTGTVTIEATVDGTDIGDFIDINIIKPAAPFTTGKMYLVGNRNYQASSLDFDHASWDDSDYAIELNSMPDPNYKNQWALTDFHFERYDIASNGGDLFKIRSVDWPEFSLDQASTKSAYFTEEGNLAVSNSEKYDLYFKENLDDSFSLYIMSEFKNGTMYLVGNRDYHTGESSGVAGTDTSWNDSSKALALTYNENKGEYHVANTFEVNDEFKVRSDMFYDLVLGQDQATASIAHQDGETGNIILDKEGKFDIYFKSELGVWTVYMCDYVEPTPFMWGIAGSGTGWKLDTAHPFVESTVEGDALYTYKLNGFEFAKGATWKVANTDGEWVSNQAGVGFDTSRSTEGAFTVNVEGNIEVETAGVYDITLNIWEGASKTGSDFTSGVQIYAVKQAGPGPTPVEPTSVSIDQDGPITVKNGKTTTLSATIGPDGATGTLVWSSDNASVVAVDASTGVVTCNADEGSANISVKVLGHDDLTDSIVVNAAPDTFAWGIAGSHITDWGLDTAHPFVESTVEGDAKYTYKISGYEFSENTEWKVKNTNNEWVANQSGVGFDSAKSTANAFSINNGNIKVLTAGTYDITLNIWEGATKDEYNNFINGVQIYAVKQAGPVVPSITFGVSSPEVEIGGYSQIPVTTSECSDIVYSVTAGGSYVEIVDAQSDDTKLVVHGLQEGITTIKALASNGTFSTIDVKCAEAPETSRFYIETKPWFNSGSLDEHVYVYTYKAGSDPMKENAVFPGEEATYVKDLDAGKKLFYFDIAEIYDTFIVTKRVGTTNSYQTNDIAISDFGTDNCMWMGDESASVETKIETGFYNYALGLSKSEGTIAVGSSLDVSITNFIGDISYEVNPDGSAIVSIVDGVASISSSTLGTTTITFSDESSSAPVVFTLKVEEIPTTTRVYFETKSWFNSNQPGEKVYAYAFKNGSNPIEQNAAWPGEEATWLRDGDNGKKIFYFDVLGDYDTIIFVRVVDGTSYAQTSDISLSAMGENNCVYLVSDSYATTAEVGYYTLVV